MNVDILGHVTPLVHADNVHFQHSAQLVRALTEADVQFQLQVCDQSQNDTLMKPITHLCVA